MIVPLKELVEKEIKMKQTRRFVNSVTLKNVHWQLEQQTISDCVIMKLITRPIFPLLATNIVLENNKLDHICHLFIQNLYTSTWSCF